jgi:hypothetical protein
MATEIVTYAYPVAGTTAPTAAQVAQLSMVTAQVSFVDTSTTVVVTHNFGTTLAQGSNQFPIVIVTPQTPGTNAASVDVVLTNSVSITLNKVSALASGGTYAVYIMRPNTMIT